MAVLSAWELLLRVASEGLTMWHGHHSDPDVRPVDRSNGFWINDENEVVVWFRQRKHKPNRTVMKRSCTCAKTTKVCCLACRMRTHLRRSNPGEKLWSFKQAEFLIMMKEPLQKMGITGADEMKLKAFRASKAWQMVRD